MQNFNVVVVVFAIFLAGCTSSKDKETKESKSRIISDLISPNNILINRVDAKEEYMTFITDTNANLMKGEILIKDSITLISIIEPILFDIYGKSTIRSERPYVMYLFGDDWIVMGSMLEDS